VAVMVRASYAREDFAALSARWDRACAQLSQYFQKNPPVTREELPVCRRASAGDAPHAG